MGNEEYKGKHRTPEGAASSSERVTGKRDDASRSKHAAGKMPLGRGRSDKDKDDKR